jgi:hypothetical protein
MNELHVLGRPGFPLDDPYIHLQFARNLATGHGLSFNAGEATPGATSPLWVVLLAAGMSLRLPGEWLALALGALAAAATAALVLEVGLNAGLAWPLAFLAGVVTAASGRFQWAALSGMETCLAAMLSLLLLWFLQLAVWTRTRAVILGVVAGLCVVARPEMALLAAAAFVVILLGGSGRSARERFPILGCYLAGLLALTLPYVIFCLATTGRPLPNTFYAKSLVFALANPKAMALLRQGYLWDVLRWAWVDNPAIAILLPIGLPAWIWTRGRGASALLAWWPVLFWIYAIMLNPRHFSLSRYTIPLIPLQALLAVGVLDGAARWARSYSKRAVAWGLAAVALVAASAHGLTDARDAYLVHVDNILGIQVKMADWIARNLPASARIATNDVGAITYYAGRYCIDTEGLVASRLITMELASQRESPRPSRDTVIARFFAQARPDYCILFPAWYPTLVRQPWLERVYSIDRRNFTGGDDHFVAYRVIHPPWDDLPRSP